MSSTNVIHICQPPRVFTMEEANELIPLMQRITERHENAVSKLLDTQRFFLISGASKEAVEKIDPQVGSHMVQWASKLTKLGCKVFSHGYVGLDSGFGYWSWHHGEQRITYYHGYNEDPFKRISLSVVNVKT